MIWAFDPGVNGALAKLAQDRLDTWRWSDVWSWPENAWETLRIASREGRLWVEQVAGSPIMGTRAFAFGRALGQFEGRLGTCEASVRRVTPQRWQRGVGFEPVAEKKKGALYEHAKALGLVCPRQCADAALISWYGWRDTYGTHPTFSPSGALP